MFVLPKRRLFRLQLKLFGILSSSVCCSILILLVLFYVYNPPSIPSTEPQPGGVRIIEMLLRISLPFILVIGVIISLVITFFWIPSLTVISESPRGKMIWTRTHHFIPERIFLLELGSCLMKCKRKRKSIFGLLLKEVELEIHFPVDFLDFKEISDYIQKDRIIYTPNERTILKTVKLEYVPINIFQIQELVSTLNSTKVKYDRLI